MHEVDNKYQKKRSDGQKAKGAEAYGGLCGTL